MRHALVFGGSGQIGRPLLERLVADGWQVSALSRSAQPASPGVAWLRGDFDHAGTVPARCDAIFSCGPLDHFARWYATSAIACGRVIAFGSTSVEVKHDSDDADERDVAARLRVAESTVLDAARGRGAAATLLRPTLVYGAGSDRTLSRIVALAARWHRCVLPASATGLRQPVHVEDLAAAACACADARHGADGTFALPGGETLPYREMAARVLGTLEPPVRLHLLPSPLFSLLLHGAHAAGIARDLRGAALRRMQRDLVFDATTARDAFGYAPRPFEPTRAMFAPPAVRQPG